MAIAAEHWGGGYYELHVTLEGGLSVETLEALFSQPALDGPFLDDTPKRMRRSTWDELRTAHAQDVKHLHLNITAQSGSGNLLGNLLCSVAHLLDNTGGGSSGLSGLLQQLTSLLNQILAPLLGQTAGGRTRRPPSLA